jgi:hypothetical protein
MDNSSHKQKQPQPGSNDLVGRRVSLHGLVGFDVKNNGLMGEVVSVRAKGSVLGVKLSGSGLTYNTSQKHLRLLDPEEAAAEEAKEAMAKKLVLELSNNGDSGGDAAGGGPDGAGVDGRLGRLSLLSVTSVDVEDSFNFGPGDGVDENGDTLKPLRVFTQDDGDGRDGGNGDDDDDDPDDVASRWSDDFEGHVKARRSYGDDADDNEEEEEEEGLVVLKVSLAKPLGLDLVPESLVVKSLVRGMQVEVSGLLPGAAVGPTGVGVGGSGRWKVVKVEAARVKHMGEFVKKLDSLRTAKGFNTNVSVSFRQQKKQQTSASRSSLESLPEDGGGKKRVGIASLFGARAIKPAVPVLSDKEAAEAAEAERTKWRKYSPPSGVGGTRSRPVRASMAIDQLDSRPVRASMAMDQLDTPSRASVALGDLMSDRSPSSIGGGGGGDATDTYGGAGVRGGLLSRSNSSATSNQDFKVQQIIKLRRSRGTSIESEALSLMPDSELEMMAAEASASRIQAVARGRKERQGVAEEKKQHAAAVRVQKAYKRHRFARVVATVMMIEKKKKWLKMSPAEKKRRALQDGIEQKKRDKLKAKLKAKEEAEVAEAERKVAELAARKAKAAESKLERKKKRNSIRSSKKMSERLARQEAEAALTSKELDAAEKALADWAPREVGALVGKWVRLRGLPVAVGAASGRKRHGEDRGSVVASALAQGQDEQEGGGGGDLNGRQGRVVGVKNQGKIVTVLLQQQKSEEVVEAEEGLRFNTRPRNVLALEDPTLAALIHPAYVPPGPPQELLQALLEITSKLQHVFDDEKDDEDEDEDDDEEDDADEKEKMETEEGEKKGSGEGGDLGGASKGGGSSDSQKAAAVDQSSNTVRNSSADVVSGGINASLFAAPPVGTRVKLVGLVGEKARVALNGSVGSVTAIRSNGSIIAVLLDVGRRINARTQNVHMLGPRPKVGEKEAVAALNRSDDDDNDIVDETVLAAAAAAAVAKKGEEQQKDFNKDDEVLSVSDHGKQQQKKHEEGGEVLVVGKRVEVFGLEGKDSKLNGKQGKVEALLAAGHIVTVSFETSRPFERSSFFSFNAPKAHVRLVTKTTAAAAKAEALKKTKTKADDYDKKKKKKNGLSPRSGRSSILTADVAPHSLVGKRVRLVGLENNSSSTPTPSRPNSSEKASSSLSSSDDDASCFAATVPVWAFGVLGTAMTSEGKFENVAPPPFEVPGGGCAFVDPAGLHHIQPPGGPKGAHGASGAIYKAIGISHLESFPADVQASVTKTSDAKYHMYTKAKTKKEDNGGGDADNNDANDKDEVHVIHTVGPDLRKDFDPVNAPGVAFTRPQALGALSRAYRNILSEFVASKQPMLRLLPVSGSIFAGAFLPEMPALTFEALQAGFGLLEANEKRALTATNSQEEGGKGGGMGGRRSIGLCVFSENELELFYNAGFPTAVEAATAAVEAAAALALKQSESGASKAELNGQVGMVETVRASGQIVTVVLAGGRKFNTRYRNLKVLDGGEEEEEEEEEEEDEKGDSSDDDDEGSGKADRGASPSGVAVAPSQPTAAAKAGAAKTSALSAKEVATTSTARGERVSMDRGERASMDAAPLSLVGEKVKLVDLEGDGKAELNGQVGTVETVRASGQIVTVVLAGGRKFNTRYRNLRVLDGMSVIEEEASVLDESSVMGDNNGNDGNGAAAAAVVGSSSRVDKNSPPLTTTQPKTETAAGAAKSKLEVAKTLALEKAAAKTQAKVDAKAEAKASKARADEAHKQAAAEAKAEVKAAKAKAEEAKKLAAEQKRIAEASRKEQEKQEKAAVLAAAEEEKAKKKLAAAAAAEERKAKKSRDKKKATSEPAAATAEAVAEKDRQAEATAAAAAAAEEAAAKKRAQEDDAAAEAAAEAAAVAKQQQEQQEQERTAAEAAKSTSSAAAEDQQGQDQKRGTWVVQAVVEVGARVKLANLDGDSSELNGSEGIVETVRASGKIVTVVLAGGRKFNTRARNIAVWSGSTGDSGGGGGEQGGSGGGAGANAGAGDGGGGSGGANAGSRVTLQDRVKARREARSLENALMPISEEANL